MRSYARYWMEAFRLPALSRTQLLAGFRLDPAGVDLLAADVAAGRGAVVALPHAGNWDAAGAWVAATGWPITTVAERLKPEAVYERFLAFRQGLGMEILPTHGGGRPAFDVLVDRVRAGTVVPLLADRDLSARGVEVDFFGGRTRMPAAPRCWRSAPAPRSTSRRCGTNRTPPAPRSRVRCRYRTRTRRRWTSGSGC